MEAQVGQHTTRDTKYEYVMESRHYVRIPYDSKAAATSVAAGSRVNVNECHNITSRIKQTKDNIL